MGDFHELWDYRDGAASEQRFRDRLADGGLTDEDALSLRTQIARSLGLQRRFDEAQAELEQVEALLSAHRPLARTRHALERGRVLRSSGHPEQSIQWFRDALDLATTSGFDDYAVDAAHMLALVVPDEGLSWSLRAIELATESPDERARNWIGSLTNNTGWALFDLERYDDALEMFGRSLAFFEERNPTGRPARIARWSIAKVCRVKGEVAEALAAQRQLLEAWQAADEESGFVYEELGECLLSLGQPVEAAPWFGKAHEILCQDQWLAHQQPERLARLAELGGTG